jgi:hypothetical protein
MRKALVSFLRSFAVPGLMAFALSCGSTDEGPRTVETTEQFVSESCQENGGACLTLNTQKRVLVGQNSAFKAQLLNDFGNPVTATQLCFHFDSSAGQLNDPASGCNLTDGNGFVSGSFVGNRPDNTVFSVDAPRAFNLHVGRTVTFDQP